MTVVSNNPSWWPFISLSLFFSHWTVAAGVVVVYDWVLTLGQEIELIWRQRWSLITVLYLLTRYIGIPYSVANILLNMPLVSVTDTGCNIMNYALNGTNVIVPAMLGVIMTTRLYAMYQRSKIILILLVIIFLVVNITCGVIVAIVLKSTVGEELILSGTYMCTYRHYKKHASLLVAVIWMLDIIWEVLALCLSVWITVKHFCDLRRLGPSTGSTIRDCFRVLTKSHVLYFACYAGVSCLQLGYQSPEFEKLNPNIEDQTLQGGLQILFGIQLFVLGPRLILSVREYHAKLVAQSDAETSMNSIVFQERVHVPTSGTV